MTPSSPVAGDTVVVTATLAAGYVWVSPLPAGWSPGNPAKSKATYSVTLNAATCQTATPGTVTVQQSSCVNGVVTEAKVTPPANGGGVTYTMVPAVPKAGDTVTVTAVLADGYKWVSPLPAGWTAGVPAATTSVFHVTLDAAATCTPATPQNPTVTQAACVAGVLQPPTLTLPTTTGITYTTDKAPPYAPGTTVVVTATVKDGFAWVSPLPDPWKPGNPAATKATYTVTFAAATCQTATPGTVTVQQSSCINGVVTEAKVTPPANGGGVTYTMVPAVPKAGDAVTVTAVLADGYKWVSPLPAGWTAGVPAATTSVFHVTLNAAATCTPVTPQNPTVTQAACAAGVLQPPTLTLPTTTGITYTTDKAPPYAPGTTVVVTATLKAGFAWVSPLPDPWKPGNPAATKATYTVTFAAATCQTATPGTVTVTQATCTAGAVTVATMTLPANGVGSPMSRWFRPGPYGDGGDAGDGDGDVVQRRRGVGHDARRWTYVNPSDDDVGFEVTLKPRRRVRRRHRRR